MTRFFRNIFFYLLVFILGLWIYDYYNASNAPKNDMSYSNFMKEVQQDDVQMWKSRPNCRPSLLSGAASLPVSCP